MSSSEVKTILQKINFIETDMDLHKQILRSIPSDNETEIKKVLEKIVEQKEEIQQLRLKIKEIAPDEYNRIIAIENAAQNFRQLAKDKKFVLVNTLNETGECYITFNDGTKLECLVAAKEENGNWTVLTLDGETKEYPGGFVK